MMRLRLSIALPLAFAGALGAAEPGPQPPACRRALDALQAQEDAALAAAASASEAGEPRPAGAPGRLARLQREAARACLGGNGTPQAPARIATPAVRVPAPPAPTAAPPTAAPVPAAPPVQPLPAPRPPAVITSCDAAGCWTSDGARVHRAGGSTVIGPRGLCSVQGSVLNCP